MLKHLGRVDLIPHLWIWHIMPYLSLCLQPNTEVHKNDCAELLEFLVFHFRSTSFGLVCNY